MTMLNGVLIVGVPMVALLAAAVYIFRQVRSQGIHGQDSGPSPPPSQPTAPGKRARSQTAGEARRRNTGQKRSKTSDCDWVTSAGVQETGLENQCGICFEEFEQVKKVQLYPCRHDDICENCVNQLIMTKKRECPFCRLRIDGYVEVGSVHLVE